jgi:hypothetical protein
LTAGCLSIFPTSVLCVIIRLHLSHPVAGNFQLICRRFGRLLHERMDHQICRAG